ncbi:MAG TPA: ABC transporter permease/substrate-binding protein [Polyangiales bacterium]|nr:ABC transporter permease/substrate-binding protein [Polyangiales bacterium]
MNDVLSLAIAHLRLTVLAVTFACAFGFALGLSSLRSPRLSRLALALASLVQTIPALALLAVMVPSLAWIGEHTGAPISGIGELPALIGLTLYAILPIARAVVLGVHGIDPAIRAAASAVGMTDGQRLRLVELPLAAASIVGGLRTATAWTVGMATLATPVGAASLGNLIFGGLQTRHYDRVALGCAAAAGMALVLDGVLAVCERRVRSQRALLGLGIALIASAVIAMLTGLQLTAAKTMRFGAKSFTEQLVLSELVRCVVGDAAEVDVRSSLGTTVAFDALRHDELDAYVEYTGTAWTTLLHHREPLGRTAMQRAVESELASKFGIRVAAHLGFENAYALVVRGDDAAHRISDLGAARDRSFGGDYEFFERSEWQALRARYGLSPREKRVMDPSLLYTALAARSVDVIAGYTTDGRIDALHLRMLDDDRAAIPPYDAVVLVSPRFAREHPEIVRRLHQLEGQIDDASMRRLNARVDGGDSPRAAAASYRVCQHRQ